MLNSWSRKCFVTSTVRSWHQTFCFKISHINSHVFYLQKSKTTNGNRDLQPSLLVAQARAAVAVIFCPNKAMKFKSMTRIDISSIKAQCCSEDGKCEEVPFTCGENGKIDFVPNGKEAKQLCMPKLIHDSGNHGNNIVVGGSGGSPKGSSGNGQSAIGNSGISQNPGNTGGNQNAGNIFPNCGGDSAGNTGRNTGGHQGVSNTDGKTGNVSNARKAGPCPCAKHQ